MPHGGRERRSIRQPDPRRDPPDLPGRDPVDDAVRYGVLRSGRARGGRPLRGRGSVFITERFIFGLPPRVGIPISFAERGRTGTDVAGPARGAGSLGGAPSLRGSASLERWRSTGISRSLCVPLSEPGGYGHIADPPLDPDADFVDAPDDDPHQPHAV